MLQANEVITIQDMISYCSNKKPKLSFEPGNKFLSSNAGYSLLAGIIEQVSGKSFEDFLKAEIFEPLVLKNTFLLNESTRHYPRATSYDKKNKEKEWFLGSYNGANGIYSSAEDLLKWDQSHYTEQLVSQTSIDKAYKV